MLIALLVLMVTAILLVILNLKNQDRREELARKYYEGILQWLLGKVRPRILRLPSGYSSDGIWLSQLKLLERSVMKVRDATSPLALVIADDIYGARLSEFTKVTDNFLDAIGALLSLSGNITSDFVGRETAELDLQTRAKAFRNAADELFKHFGQ